MSTDVSEVDPFYNFKNIDPEKELRPTSAMAILSKLDDKVDENSVIVAPPAPTRLWKQQSWSPSEILREEAWVKRRDQFRLRRRKAKSLTDEDLDELRGCIDLGFRFGYPEEEEDHNLCNTLPALDFYYAVNRNFNDCKFKSSPSSSTTSMQEQTVDNRSSPSCDDSPHEQHYEEWKISSPGENPQLVKTRLRHWAQLVACSIRQSS